MKRFGDGCPVSTQLSEEFSALSSKKCSRRAILTITNYERCYSIYLGTKRLARGSEHYCDGSHETGETRQWSLKKVHPRFVITEKAPARATHLL